MPKPLFYSLAATLLLATSIRAIAATSTQVDLEKEYAQVRKIALKDPKVQEAFSKADERLNEKIIEIDPALKPIVDKQTRTTTAPVPVATPRPKVESRSVAASTPQGREHIVVKGETLGSIAAHYNVKVASLEKANHITDARKLQVGQKLVIPASESIESKPAAESQATPPRDNGGLWDRIKSNL